MNKGILTIKVISSNTLINSTYGQWFQPSNLSSICNIWNWNSFVSIFYLLWITLIALILIMVFYLFQVMKNACPWPIVSVWKLHLLYWQIFQFTEDIHHSILLNKHKSVSDVNLSHVSKNLMISIPLKTITDFGSNWYFSQYNI